MPIAVAHGEGRVEFSSESDLATAKASYVAMNFVDNYGEATTNYPANPNGSVDGITSLTTEDGRNDPHASSRACI